MCSQTDASSVSSCFAQALKKAELLQKEVDAVAVKVDSFVSQKDKSITVKELTRAIVDLTDDISQASIAHWKKDDLRNTLKTLKKRADDVERNIKAAVVNDVAEAAKKLLADHPNAPFIVHQFNAFSNTKVCGFVYMSCMMTYRLHVFISLALCIGPGWCAEAGQGFVSRNRCYLFQRGF